ALPAGDAARAGQRAGREQLRRVPVPTGAVARRGTLFRACRGQPTLPDARRRADERRRLRAGRGRPGQGGAVPAPRARSHSELPGRARGHARAFLSARQLPRCARLSAALSRRPAGDRAGAADVRAHRARARGPSGGAALPAPAAGGFPELGRADSGERAGGLDDVRDRDRDRAGADAGRAVARDRRRAAPRAQRALADDRAGGDGASDRAAAAARARGRPLRRDRAAGLRQGLPAPLLAAARPRSGRARRALPADRRRARRRAAAEPHDQAAQRAADHAVGIRRGRARGGRRRAGPLVARRRADVPRPCAGRSRARARTFRRLTTMADLIQPVRGMNDVLPADEALWQRVEHAAEAIFASYGYRRIRLPVRGRTELFKRSVGQLTDIGEKEMYPFEDRNGESLTLRPEATAGVVRAGLSNGLLHNQQQKLWCSGPMFRREKPQKGRYRQFHQLSIEALGFAEPEIDAELIAMAARLWRTLGLSSPRLEINSLGTPESRAGYKEALVEYFSAHRSALDEDSV